LCCASHLHDERCVLVCRLVELVELLDGCVECVLGEVAGLFAVSQQFVQTHAVVERDAQPLRVVGGKLRVGEFERVGIMLKTLLLVVDSNVLVVDHLAAVAVVVAAQLAEQHFALRAGGILDHGVLQQLRDLRAENLNTEQSTHRRATTSEADCR